MTVVFGIDVGGSGIKGAPVNLETGNLEQERFRLETPHSASPRPVAETIRAVLEHFDWHGPIGAGFPAAVKGGKVLTAANIHSDWLGLNIENLLLKVTGQAVTVLNDADAAGLAEMRYGAGRGCNGLVMMITIGTGIGTALFTRGVLVPNTELGHIEINGKEAERRASDAARQRKDMSWKEWGSRLNEYLQIMEKLFWPDRIIIGGGISKENARFFHFLDLNADVVPAQLLNNAGIVGAALAARSDPGDPCLGQPA
jgi:polyphosphate glucokinase